ncbi:unnamed protein product [Lota lota]
MTDPTFLRLEENKPYRLANNKHNIGAEPLKGQKGREDTPGDGEPTRTKRLSSAAGLAFGSRYFLFLRSQVQQQCFQGPKRAP